MLFLFRDGTNNWVKGLTAQIYDFYGIIEWNCKTNGF